MRVRGSVIRFKNKYHVENIKVYRAYAKQKIKSRIKKTESGIDTAVVIHLYYIEPLDLFQRKLALLRQGTYKVFVTIPRDDPGVKDMIKSRFPDSEIFVVPNRGRDVLPFLKIAKHLKQAGYTKILKIHSKKSIHRKDGDDWLSDIINELLPDDKEVREKIIQVLNMPTTSVVGPKEQYISLPVNFDANSAHIQKIIGSLFGPKIRKQVDIKRDEYGFFAGTMFWARLDALDGILNRKYTISEFDTEKGQIDGTLAHGLERVFTLYPELNGKKIYGVNKINVIELEYKTTNIPDWSDIYIGPK